MSKSPNRQASPLSRLVKGLYIVLVVLSLLVVVGYASLNLFAPEPVVDSQVTIAPNPHTVPSTDPDATPAPDATDTPAPGLVLNRRKGVYTCLMLGVADQGGTDTIMLGVFDTGAKTASLISIPRDTVVYTDKYRKINSTYSGGEEAVVEAVKNLLGVPVDYWVSVNLKAFEAIVDQIGGVYFTVPVDMNYDDPYQNLSIHISAGYKKLNGKQAVGVMRCRNCYASADIGRTATQRAFLTALAKQTITLSNVANVTALINIFSKYVRTSMPLNDMVHFGTQAIGMDLDTALTTGALEGEWVSPYWQLDDQAVLEMVNGLGIYEEEVPAQALHIVHP